MAKNILPAKASEPTSAAIAATEPPAATETTAADVAEGKNRYWIRPGVAWINGKRVGKDTVIDLSPQEAVYDLSLDRIAPADKPAPASWSKSEAPAEAAADGGD